MIILKRLLQDKGAVIALGIIVLYVFLGLAAPLVTFYDPNHIDTANKFAGISFQHLLGTDHLGRDILTRLIYAIRPSLLYVFVALFVSVLIGSILGFLSGYFQGFVDALIMRACDVMLAFPSYVVTLALIALFGMGAENIIMAFILTRWAWFCRVIRTSVMQYTASDHVRFAKTIGMNDMKIIHKHIMPLTLADIAIISSSSMCSMILQISGFSFLGLGVKAPTAEWGMMLNEARKVMFTHPEMMFAPGIAIVIIVMAFNFLSDALQIAIDPRISSKDKLRSVKRSGAIMTLLTVKHLTITDTWTDQPLVSDVNFTLTKGETLGVIGESGSGKSITCKSIIGLNPERLGVTGEIIFDGTSMLSLSESQRKKYRGKDIAMVMQQGSRAFDPSTTVGKQMFETMKVHTSMSTQEIEKTLIEYMDYLSLKDPKRILKSYPYMLSGGMLQRLMIALALALKPKLIIADEPTTALDTITQYDVLEAFIDIKKHFDCAMIFISHDLTVINKIADRVVVMKNGQLIEHGTRESVLHHPEHVYTKYLLSTKKKINDHFKHVMRGDVHD